MAIDPSIPLQVRGFSLADVMSDAQAMRMRQMQMDDYERKRRQEQEKGDSLAALIADPNGMRRDNPNFQRFAKADPTSAFTMLDRLDKAEREKVEAGLKDLSAAVRWADTPQKWAVVQQHYGRFDPQLAAVPFENREQALIQLGQMGEYLEKSAPKIMSIEAGGSLAAVDPRTGQPTFTVLPNPGNASPGAPAGSGPRPGDVEDGYRFKGGDPADPNNWIKVGGGGGNVTSGFLDGL